MNKTKPFNIEKQQVKETWLGVKTNKGSAGVDEISLETCSKNEKNYLYKLWNQMNGLFRMKRAK